MALVNVLIYGLIFCQKEKENIYVYIYIYHSKLAEEETRDHIEEVIINELPTKEAVIETVIEEEEEVKPKPKA